MNRLQATADVLDDAADLIERDGWYNGGDENDEGYCAATALSQVTRKPIAWATAQDALKRYLNVPSLPPWNDRQKSAQPVLDAMRGCARELRKQADDVL